MTLSLPNIIRENMISAVTSASHQVGVFIGATSGLGEQTAYDFAKYTTKPTIYIVGRNAKAGAKVIQRLKEINWDPECKFYFCSCDITLISEVDKLCDRILKQEFQVNLLFMTPGFLSMNGREETREGIDKKLAANYYGRWRAVQNLIPLLQNASEEDELEKKKRSCDPMTTTSYKTVNARVISVLQPGFEAMPALEDLGLKNTYTVSRAHGQAVVFNSLAVMYFSTLYPDIGFIHAGPGLVKTTNISRGLPFWIRIPFRLALLFANTPENSAERLYYMASAPIYRKGAHIIDINNKSLKERAISRGYISDVLWETVWNHTEETFEHAAKIPPPPEKNENPTTTGQQKSLRGQMVSKVHNFNVFVGRSSTGLKKVQENTPQK